MTVCGEPPLCIFSFCRGFLLILICLVHCGLMRKIVLKMGLSMVKVLKSIRKEYKDMNMRIGIHTVRSPMRYRAYWLFQRQGGGRGGAALVGT